MGIFFSVSIQQLALSERGKSVWVGRHHTNLHLHFAKCLFLDLSVHAEAHSATTVAMAAKTLRLLVCHQSNTHAGLHGTAKYTHTALEHSPSTILGISYYRNQSLGTGAHSRKSCRFQFYIVINAAGEEHLTTIAGVDCTKPDLFHPATPPCCRWKRALLPFYTHTQLPLLLVLKWFPQSLCAGMAAANACSIFQWLH